MPSLVGTTVAANYQRSVVYYPNASATQANPYVNFGTPALTFLKVTGLTGVGTNAGDANSLFTKALRGVASTAELYYASAPSADVLIVAIVANTQTDGDTKPAGGLIDTGTGYGILEAAINAATGGTSTVAAATFA